MVLLLLLELVESNKVGFFVHEINKMAANIVKNWLEIIRYYYILQNLIYEKSL